MRKTFSITGGRGFQITFPNGVILSTQFGAGNYSENYHGPFDFNKNDWASDDAEIAIIGPKGQWLTKEFKDDNDDVLPRQKFDDWLAAFNFALQWSKKATPIKRRSKS